MINQAIKNLWRGLLVLMGVRKVCADCSAPIGYDSGPRDGWQLEDGRTVCQACCVADTKRFARTLRWMAAAAPDKSPAATVRCEYLYDSSNGALQCEKDALWVMTDGEENETRYCQVHREANEHEGDWQPLIKLGAATPV